MRSPSRRRSSLLHSLVLVVGLTSLHAAPAQASWWDWWQSWWNDEIVIIHDKPDDRPGPAVPEPAALLLFGAGALTVAAAIRRRQGRKNS